MSILKLLRSSVGCQGQGFDPHPNTGNNILSSCLHHVPTLGSLFFVGRCFESKQKHPKKNPLQVLMHRDLSLNLDVKNLL